VATYSLIVGIGASLAILRVLQHFPRWQQPRWANASLLLLLACLICSRLLYVIIQWPYFRANLIEILAIWRGGLSWEGALLGAYFGIWLISKGWKSSFLKIADALTPMVPPLVVSIWMGCWLSGMAYGFSTPPDTFWGMSVMDETGYVQDRFPLQLIASVSILMFAFWLETRKAVYQKEGQKAAVMNLGLAAHLLLFMPLRADPAPALLDIRLDIWAALFFFFISAVFFYWQFFTPESTLEKI